MLAFFLILKFIQRQSLSCKLLSHFDFLILLLCVLMLVLSPVAAFVLLEKIHLARSMWHPCWCFIPFEYLLHSPDEGPTSLLSFYLFLSPCLSYVCMIYFQNAYIHVYIFSSFLCNLSHTRFVFSQAVLEDFILMHDFGIFLS